MTKRKVQYFKRLHQVKPFKPSGLLKSPANMLIRIERKTYLSMLCRKSGCNINAYNQRVVELLRVNDMICYLNLTGRNRYFTITSKGELVRQELIKLFKLLEDGQNVGKKE